MSRRLALALAPTLVPRPAEACASCVTSAFGDQTYNWAYIGLMAVPFVVLGVIGGVLAYCYVRTVGSSAGPLALSRIISALASPRARYRFAAAARLALREPFDRSPRGARGSRPSAAASRAKPSARDKEIT